VRLADFAWDPDQRSGAARPLQWICRDAREGAKIRHVFGFFPGGSRGSGQYQSQLYAISVAAARSVPFDNRPHTDQFRRRRVQMPLRMVRGQFTNLLLDAGVGRIIETPEADELFHDRPDRGVRTGAI
jgi:hypothetical protein